MKTPVYCSPRAMTIAPVRVAASMIVCLLGELQVRQNFVLS